MGHSTFHGSAKLCSSKDEENKIEPGKLLEECWFFGNLLDKQPKMMLRSFSDPCTSLNFRQEIDFAGKSYEETYESIQKLPKSRPSGLVRSSTAIPHQPVRESDHTGRRKSNGRKSSKNLNRAPSLPIRLEIEEFDDEEMEFSMGNLIRQASLNDADTMPPKRRPAKGISRSCSMSSHQSRMKPSTKLEGRQINQIKTQKSLSVLESEELQGFKDLGFDLDKKDLSPNVISIIPGLQEKSRSEEDEEKNTRRPYLSEAWRAWSSAPPVPRWGGKRSTDEIKAQIKFWARAVASNVHQEC